MATTTVKIENMSEHQKLTAQAMFLLIERNLRISSKSRPAATYSPVECLDLNITTLTDMAKEHAKVIKLDKTLSEPDEVATMLAAITGTTKKTSTADLENQLRYTFLLNLTAVRAIEAQRIKESTEKRVKLADIEQQERELQNLELQLNPEARKAKLEELAKEKKALNNEE